MKTPYDSEMALEVVVRADLNQGLRLFPPNISPRINPMIPGRTRDRTERLYAINQPHSGGFLAARC